MEKTLYEQIEEERNKQFPPKLELGCWITSVHHNYRKIVYRVEERNVHYCDGSFDHMEHFENGNMTTQGLPVSLNDVMKMFYLSERVHGEMELGNDFIKITYDTGEDIESFDIYPSMSIKDQGEEGLKIILDLIQ